MTHRRLEQRGLQRRRAARDQRQVRGGERLVGMAEKQSEGQVGPLVLIQRALEQVARVARHHRHDEVHVVHLLAEAVRGEDERARHVLQLGAAAAGQQRDDQLARRQAQLRTRLLARRVLRDDVRQRVADVGDRHADLLVERHLERKHHQDVVDRARHAGARASASTPIPTG